MGKYKKYREKYFIGDVILTALLFIAIVIGGMTLMCLMMPDTETCPWGTAMFCTIAVVFVVGLYTTIFDVKCHNNPILGFYETFRNNFILLREDVFGKHPLLRFLGYR